MEGKTPETWNAAISGKEVIDHMLYDGALSTTSANTTLTIFDQTEASAGLDQSNMPSDSSLPSAQHFLIKEINVHFNDVLASADAENLLDRASFELRVNDRRMLAGPLREFMSPATVIPAGVTQDEQYFVGAGYKLENYIHIPGGVKFNVFIETGETAAGASTELTVVLKGLLAR